MKPGNLKEEILDLIRQADEPPTYAEVCHRLIYFNAKERRYKGYDGVDEAIKELEAEGLIRLDASHIRRTEFGSMLGTFIFPVGTKR